MMSIIFFGIAMFFIVVSLFMGIQLIRSIWNCKVPKSYYAVFWITSLVTFSISISVARFCQSFDGEGKIFEVLMLLNLPMLFTSIASQCMSEKLEATFSQVLLKGIRDFHTEYQLLTAEKFAEENEMEYVPDAVESKLDENYGRNAVISKDNKFVLLHPANDGLPTCPIAWYGRFVKVKKGKEVISYKLIMDNQQSFDCITNLDEIILSMIHLYKDNIDKDVFIASDGFAIKLEDEPKEYYTGRAKLVLTDDVIRNDRVALNKKEEAKKYFLNEFLDHFIGWNFGVVIKNSSKLEKELNEFNELVISKGLRKYAGTGFEVWQDEYVKPYDLKTE